MSGKKKIERLHEILIYRAVTVFYSIHIAIYSLFFCACRMTGQVSMLGGLGGGGISTPSKIVLTLDDLVFINTQLSKRVSNTIPSSFHPQTCLNWFCAQRRLFRISIAVYFYDNPCAITNNPDLMISQKVYVCDESISIYRN